MIQKILFLFFCFTLWQGASAQIAVIAHKSVPHDSVKKNELVDFYTGDIKVWKDDSQVVVFDLKPRLDIKIHFYKYLGKSPSRMKSIWLKKMLSGEGDPPTAIKTEKDMLKKVETTAGAIGFVRQSMVTDKVKTVLVIPEQ